MHPPSIETESAESEGIFRESSHGARARRDYLLQRRRHEYAILSHAVRRIFVGRVARAVACAVGAGGALKIFAGARDHDIYLWLCAQTPGPNPAPLATILAATWIASVMAYFVARSMAEDYYARAISKTVQPTDDLYADLARLEHMRPELMAHRLAARVETASVIGPFLGLCLLGPLTLIYVMIAFAKGDVHVPGEFDARLVESISFTLPAMAMFVALAAYKALRLRRGPRAVPQGEGLGAWWVVVGLLLLWASWSSFHSRSQDFSLSFISVTLLGLFWFKRLASIQLERERTVLATLLARVPAKSTAATAE